MVFLVAATTFTLLKLSGNLFCINQFSVSMHFLRINSFSQKLETCY